MFKRITAFLTVLFMGLVLTVRSPVKADTFSIPFSAIPDLLNAFYTVAAGGKIEFSALIGDITGIDDFLENLHDYYNEHYTQPLLQSTQGLIDIGLSGLALEGIDSIDSVNNLTIPITPLDIANFIGYDVNWADRYNDVEQVLPNPDLTYISYINKLNKRDTMDPSCFWFYDIPVEFNYSGNANVKFKLYNYPTYNYSYCVSIPSNSFTFSYQSQPFLRVSDILDINIYSYNNSYAIYETVNCYSIAGEQYNRGLLNSQYKAVNFTSYNGNLFELGNNASFSDTLTFSFNGTLEECLTYCTQKFKNVNLYVDDVLWSYVGDVQNPAIALNDYTNVGNTGNITYGVFPLTSTGDIGLDLAKWGEYIYNQCISGVDSLSMDTVIDDGWDLVDTEDGERAITQDDEEDVAKVIHGFVDTTATTPTPTPDIGDPPVLKIIPPILELPDEIWPDGGRDTTVLAQMVHATDVAIPNDIMTVIWSTIGLLVVGGLISILHK